MAAKKSIFSPLPYNFVFTGRIPRGGCGQASVGFYVHRYLGTTPFHLHSCKTEPPDSEFQFPVSLTKFNPFSSVDPTRPTCIVRPPRFVLKGQCPGIFCTNSRWSMYRSIEISIKHNQNPFQQTKDFRFKSPRRRRILTFFLSNFLPVGTYRVGTFFQK